MKKAYISPNIIVHGTLEEITQGSKSGIADWFRGSPGGVGILPWPPAPVPSDPSSGG